MAQQVRTSPAVAASSATVANPAPLGLSGFALTTFVLSVMNTGIISSSQYLTVVVGLAIFYGGLAQLLAGMWEFRTGNTFGATAFSSFGAFWLSYAAFFIPGFGVSITHLSNPHPALGLYLLGWMIFTALMTLGAIRVNGGTAAVFVLLTLTFAALAIGELATADFFGKLGGWLGIATAVAAWYTALAGVLAHVGGPFQLPVFPVRK